MAQPLIERQALNCVQQRRLQPAMSAVGSSAVAVQTLLQDKSVIEGIRARKTVTELKQPWAAELEEFRKRREGFLLYR